jgi:hypothetical protein
MKKIIGLFVILTITFISLVSALNTKNENSGNNNQINNNGDKRNFNINTKNIHDKKKDIIQSNFLQLASEEKLEENNKEKVKKETPYFEGGYNGNGCENFVGYGQGNGYLDYDGYSPCNGNGYCGDSGYGNDYCENDGLNNYCYPGRNNAYINGSPYNSYNIGLHNDNDYLGGYAHPNRYANGYENPNNCIGNFNHNPYYSGNYYQGKGYINGRQDLREKYISLNDAAALLARERERKHAEYEACKNSDKNSISDSNANYLNKECLNHNKLYNENNSNNSDINSGKDLCKEKCNSANDASCSNDKNYLTKKSHSGLKSRNKSNDALCMNSNNLDKFCSDGDSLEECDQLLHFKKCCNGHKEKLNGKDCFVKKSECLHNIKDTHSLDFNDNLKHNSDKGISSSDSRESCNYHDHDLKNSNSKANICAEDFKNEDDITKACKDASSRDCEIKRENSNAICVDNKDKLLKKVCDKNIEEGCADKQKFIDAAICKEADNNAILPPVC